MCDIDGCLTPWDVQSRRVHTVDCAWPTLYGGEGGGHGYVITEVSNTVDETVPSAVLKVRCGSGTWVKPNGSIGTAGKGVLVSEDVTFTVTSTQDQTLFQSNMSDLPNDGYVVRRLTPTECERLQGMPDEHTNLSGSDPNRLLELMPQAHEMDARAKTLLERKVHRWCRETPDGPRYKAIGNSFAVPCVHWIFKRIDDIDKMKE